MTNISVDTLSLDDLIDKLSKNNQEVYDIIKSVNDAIRTLDENAWNSTEKKKMDEGLNPYMKNIESSFPAYLDECIDVLKRASDLYKNINLKKKDKVEDVSDYITMDVI